jgi:acyl-CoA thioesterase
MTFDRAVTLERGEPGRYAGTTSDAYWNLIGPFGGWIAAVLLAALSDGAPPASAPLSLSTNFAAAIEPGPFVVTTRNLRRNRSTDFWFAELMQTVAGSATHCANATAVFAGRRSTAAYREVEPPDVAAPESLPRADLAQIAVKWFARYDIRVAAGGISGESASNRAVAWIRDLPSRPLDYLSLAALCDCSFPQIFARTGQAIPISTITMNIFFHATPAELAAVGDDFILSDSTMRVAGHGFFDQLTMLWSRAGTLLATTEQVVWFKFGP